MDASKIRVSHLEVSPKSYHVRFYHKHPDRYCASVMLHIDGDKGFAYSLQGKRFYELFAIHYKELFERCGIRSIEAYMTEEHSAHFIKATSEFLTVKVTEKGTCAGRPMHWMCIKMKEVK